MGNGRVQSTRKVSADKEMDGRETTCCIGGEGWRRRGSVNFRTFGKSCVVRSLANWTSIHLPMQRQNEKEPGKMSRPPSLSPPPAESAKVSFLPHLLPRTSDTVIGTANDTFPFCWLLPRSHCTHPQVPSLNEDLRHPQVTVLFFSRPHPFHKLELVLSGHEHVSLLNLKHVLKKN